MASMPRREAASRSISSAVSSPPWNAPAAASHVRPISVDMLDTGIDVLQLGGRSYHATEVAGGTLLDLGGGDRILLSDVFDFI